MSKVRDFGAVGDGKSDDTKALQHAIDTSKGALVFGAGVYRITKPLVVRLDRRGPVGLVGSGGSATVRMEGAGSAFRLLGNHKGTGDPGSVTPGVWAKERMPTVSNIAVEGTHAEADGFELVQTMQVLFEGVHISKCRHGIRLWKRNRNVLISHCHIYFNTGVGVFLDEVNLHQINIIGNHISYNRLGGIRVQGSEVRNLQITGNDIEYNNHRAHKTEPEPTAEVYIDTTAEGASVNEVTVASNTIQATVSPGGTNLRILEKRDKSRPPGLWAITGNIIGSQEHNVHLTGCHGIVITGNCIYSCEKHNVLIEDSTQVNMTGNNFRRHTETMGTGVRLVGSHDCILSGSSLRDEHPEGQVSKKSLLELEGCERITVNGCQFLDGVPFGLHSVNSSGVNVSGCTFADTRGKPLGSGVRFEGKGSRNVLVGNVFGSFAGDSIHVAKESGVTQSNNVGDDEG